MATFDEQVLRLWDEWESLTGADANNPDDFIAWAVENKRLFPRLQDVQRILRKQVTTVLRQAVRQDDGGFTYRAKQCVLIIEEGNQYRLWFDTDRGGTTNLRQKATRQRRDGIASDVYKAVCDVDHMNNTFRNDPRLKFLMDFSEDVAEKRAAELAARDEDDDDSEAA